MEWEQSRQPDGSAQQGFILRFRRKFAKYTNKIYIEQKKFFVGYKGKYILFFKILAIYLSLERQGKTLVYP